MSSAMRASSKESQRHPAMLHLLIGRHCWLELDLISRAACPGAPALRMPTKTYCGPSLRRCICAPVIDLFLGPIGRSAPVLAAPSIPGSSLRFC